MAWDDWLIGGGSDYSTGDTGSVSDAWGSAGEDYGFEGRNYTPTTQTSGYYGDTSQMSYAPQQTAYWDSIFSSQKPDMNYAPQVQQTQQATFTPGAGPSASLGNQWAGISPSMTTAASTAPAFGDYLQQGVTLAEGGLNKLSQWGRQNPRLADFASKLLPAALAYNAQNQAAGLIKQQQGAQQAVAAKNAAIADTRNQLAQQQINQALSLYNPQEMGRRGMAQQQALAGQQLQRLEQQMASRGYSPADIAAAKRRAQVGDALGATYGFMQGYDTGRSALQGALQSAVALGQQYAAPADNTAMATYLRQAGTASGKTYGDMITTLLGDPNLEVAKRNVEVASPATRKRAGLNVA